MADPYRFGIPVTPWYPQNPVPEYPGHPLPNSGGPKMAKIELGDITVTLDDESKDLIRQLVKAVDRIANAQAPDTDKSFGDGPRKLREVQERVLRQLRGDLPGGEGDHLLHDDGREGEELE